MLARMESEGARAVVLHKDGGSTSVILEVSLCAACVILRHPQSLVSPLQLLATGE